MNRCYVFNAGCIRRGLDSVRIQKYLEINGWTSTGSLRQADLIVIATCGVVQANETHSLQAIEKAISRKASAARIVITGCLPNIHLEAIRKLGDFLCVPTQAIETFDRILNPKVRFRDVRCPDSVSESRHITNYLMARSFCRRSWLYKRLFNYFGMNQVFLTASVYGNKLLRHVGASLRPARAKRLVPYYNIAIARGCLSSCTFCATKQAIGLLVSRPPEEILEEFRVGLAKGYQVFQLISEDTGCYGLDIGTSMPQLLQKMCSHEGPFSIVIIDYHPRWLISQCGEMVPALIEHQDHIKELFIPIQSGSDRILAWMQRNHTAGDLKSILQTLNLEAPRIALRTSLLVGFPGETEEDFEATKAFIRDIDFAEVTVNRYEDRPNTASSRMDAKVDQDTIERRARNLAEHMGCHILS